MLKSWDIFDTLIARRCVYPHNIFRIVEQISRITNFANVRIVAEQNLEKKGIIYNFDDIYEEFRKLTNASEKLCDELKTLEIKTEIDQCIPITENLRQVKAGDILISDMYLPEKVIRKMLDKADLLVPVEIVVTSGGKSSGRIWQQLAQQNEFVFHIGDNPISDIQIPSHYGFESASPILGIPTQFELWLMQRDFNFATYLRALRLKNPFTEEIKRTYWSMFTINVGTLILLAQLIDNMQKTYGFEYLGFCGRDTYWLRLLYQKYKADHHEEPAANDYLYYSRKLVRYSESDVEKYFASKIADRKALMIDVAGMGMHLHKLRVEKAIDYSILICFLMGTREFRINYYNDMKHFPENWSEFNGSVDEIGISSKNFTFHSGEKNLHFFEFLNRATHNTPIRLKTIQIDEKIVPKITFSEMNDTENFDVIESCIKEVLNSNVTWCNEQHIPALIETLKGIVSIFLTLGKGSLLSESHRRTDKV